MNSYKAVYQSSTTKYLRVEEIQNEEKNLVKSDLVTIGFNRHCHDNANTFSIFFLVVDRTLFLFIYMRC